MNNFKYLLLFLWLPLNVCFGQADDASSASNKGEKLYKIRAVAELGFLGVLDHRIQYGRENTTYFDYVRDGGQDVLYPTTRLSLELDFKKRNTFILLYQPLNIETQVVLRQSVQIDDVFFPSATNLNTTYSFPFYRFGYLRHVKFKGDKFKLALGASIQIRNATIKFESSNGDLLKVTSNVGIVPLIKLRTSYRQSKFLTVELEADGMYAPISYLNGNDNDVLGAIIDVSLRQYFQLMDQARLFVNVRYIGGGGEGQSDDTLQVTDGYTKNWLHLCTVSGGFVYEF
ncbi:MAG: hypothetical protein AB8E82_15900 [Aureispira sp.]